MDRARTCTLCGRRCGPLTGHDLGPEGFVCATCYDAAASLPTMLARVRELRVRLRAQRRVWLALAAFWALAALLAFVAWRVAQELRAPDAREIRGSEAWEDEPR